MIDSPTGMVTATDSEMMRRSHCDLKTAMTRDSSFDSYSDCETTRLIHSDFARMKTSAKKIENQR